MRFREFASPKSDPLPDFVKKRRRRPEPKITVDDRTRGAVALISGPPKQPDKR